MPSGAREFRKKLQISVVIDIVAVSRDSMPDSAIFRDAIMNTVEDISELKGRGQWEVIQKSASSRWGQLK
jgi:hypothetical protein